MSAQVAKLERELGQPLLERAGRGERLTSAGDAVPPLARAALASVDAIGGLARLVRGRVRRGMICGCSIPPILDALAAFGIHYPDVELDLWWPGHRRRCWAWPPAGPGSPYSRPRWPPATSSAFGPSSTPGPMPGSG